MRKHKSGLRTAKREPDQRGTCAKKRRQRENPVKIQMSPKSCEGNICVTSTEIRQRLEGKTFGHI